MSIGVELRQYISQTHTKKFLNPANPPPLGTSVVHAGVLKM